MPVLVHAFFLVVAVVGSFYYAGFNHDLCWFGAGASAAFLIASILR